ncbi:MAG: hypothetical protein WCI05_18810 [Myxococcales bacterium]
MTLEEAASILEISPVSSAIAARRAYLQKLKRHKPERDPAGFMRLREAYDRFTAEAGVDELVAMLRTQVAESSSKEAPRDARTDSAPVTEQAPAPRPSSVAETTPPPSAAPSSSPPPTNETAPSAEETSVEPDAPVEGAPEDADLEKELVAAGLERSLVQSSLLFPRVIDRVLELLSSSELDEAIALYRALDASSYLSGGAIRRLHEPSTGDPDDRNPLQDVALQWVMVGELVGVARELDARARTGIASALRTANIRDCYHFLQIPRVGAVLRRARARGDAPVLGSIQAEAVRVFLEDYQIRPR